MKFLKKNGFIKNETIAILFLWVLIYHNMQETFENP